MVVQHPDGDYVPAGLHEFPGYGVAAEDVEAYSVADEFAVPVGPVIVIDALDIEGQVFAFP